MVGGEDSDEALVERAGRGDHTAASALVVRHTDRIFGACYRLLGERAAAEDAAQETFLRLWKNAARWRPKGAKFETWLYKVAMNICVDKLRKRWRELPEDAAPEIADGAPSAEDAMISDSRKESVDAAIAKLPERQRLAITLCHYQELSNIDAASIMDISIEAVESLLARGRRALRESLVSKRDELMEGVGNDR